MNEESQTFESSVGPVQFTVKGDGIPVLILHGRAGGYDQGASIMPFLKGIRGICPSGFGYLKTVMPENASITNYADICISLLDHLGIEKFGIIALSAGGPTALHIASKQQNRCIGICMLSAVTQKYSSLPAAQKPSFQMCTLSGFPYWVISNIFIDILISSSMSKREMELLRKDKPALSICRQFVGGFPISLRARAILAEADNIANLDPIPFDKIKCPAFVVHGDADTIVPIAHARLLLDSLSSVDLMTIPGGSHFSMLSHNKDVFKKVNEFMSVAYNNSLPYVKLPD
jgi:pimeloyl-ACP methyl ester carboxylesterase